jgi:hypothetical protein
MKNQIQSRANAIPSDRCRVTERTSRMKPNHEISKQRRSEMNARTGIVTLVLSMLFCMVNDRTAVAGQGQDGNQGGIHLKTGIQIPNPVGLICNDLHLHCLQKEGNINMNGAAANSTDFANVVVAMTPPHGANIDLSGGTVAKGASTVVNLDFWISEKNQIWFDVIQWTIDGQVVASWQTMGWKITFPQNGGGGGNPGNQDGKGGVGKFVHKITIYNDKTDSNATLQFLYAYASMTQFANLWTDVPWSGCVNLISGPITIPAGGSVTIDFETTGAYANGFINLYYSIDDPMFVVGEHPVGSLETVPTVSEWGLIIMAGLLLTAGAIVIVRRRKPVAA